MQADRSTAGASKGGPLQVVVLNICSANGPAAEESQEISRSGSRSGSITARGHEQTARQYSRATTLTRSGQRARHLDRRRQPRLDAVGQPARDAGADGEAAPHHGCALLMALLVVVRELI